MNITLVCEDSFDGIMTAVYDGWVLMNQGHIVNIYPGDSYEPSFFSTFQPIKTNLDKAYKVSESIRRKISVKAHTMVFRASLHYDRNKGDIIFGFLKIAYPMGAKVIKMLGNDYVMQLMELSRKVENEAHLFKGFVRFKELVGSVLYSSIEPKCDVLPVIGYHFQERYPLENWIIYDERRKKAVVHPSGQKYFFLNGQDLKEQLKHCEAKDDYEDLWKVFFNTISIESRKNDKCQNTNVPKWYRKNMIEFTEQQ